MNDIATMIAQYKIGCDKVRQRIVLLNEQIGAASKEGMPSKELIDRRYLLYNELADMQYAIGSLEEYQQNQGNYARTRDEHL